MCLRAVIMLHYVPGGLGDRLGAWPRSRSAGWRIWVLEAPGACRKAAWRSWPSSSRAGQGGSEGHGSGSSRLLAALQVSAAQRPRSPRPLARCLPSPPPASSLILQAACQERPGRAQACSRARDSQGRPGRRGQAAALPAPLCAGPRRPRPSIYTPARPGLPTSAPPCRAPASRPSGILLLCGLFLPKVPTFPSCPNSHKPDRRAALGQEADPTPTHRAHGRAHTHRHTYSLCRPGCRQTAHFQGAPGPTPERSTRVRPSRAAKRRLQAHRRAPGRMRNNQEEPPVTSTSQSAAPVDVGKVTACPGQEA